MAKRSGGERGGGGASAPKKKSSAGPKAKGKKGKASTGSTKGTGSTAGSSSSSRAEQFNNKKKQQSSQSPPWQVMSQKDLAKNVKAEKERRKLAQQGIHNVKEDVDFKVSKSFLSIEDKTLLAWKRFSQSPQDEIDFIGAYLNKQLPPRLGAPEVAFLGRSNVGKSSLLNKLVNSESARVGKTPGATASVNLYGIFRKEKAILGLVDLPGFGYAKLSKESKESVQEAAENYLGKRKELVLGILLVDIRREPSDDDRAVLAALYDMGRPIIVVATKIDKLSPSQLDGQLEKIQIGLGLPPGQPFSVSSVTGQGVKEMWRIIMEACESGVYEMKVKMEKGMLEGDVLEPTEVFQDEDDLAYSQGYDWVHDSESSVMYEYEDGEDQIYNGDDGGEEGFYDEYDEQGGGEEAQMVNPRETLKYLRQKAKDMEKRGEFGR